MVMAIESHMVHRLTIITLQKYSVMGLSRLALIPRWRSFCFSAFFLAPVFFFGILYQVKFSYVFSFTWTKSWPTRLRCNKLPGDSKGECEVCGWIKKPLTENRNKKGYNLVPSLLAFWSGHEIGQKNGGVFAVLSDNFQSERLEDLDLLVWMGQEYGYHLGSSLNEICNHHHHRHQSLLYLTLLRDQS